MSIVSLIKSKIEECNQTINEAPMSPGFKDRVLRGVIPASKVAKVYEEEEMQSADFRKSYPGIMMKKNQAKENLEVLNVELTEAIRNSTKLFLISDLKLIEESLSDKNYFEMYHNAMAHKIANFVMPAIRPGDVLNANLVSIINDVLDNVEEEIGILSALTSRLELKSDCVQIIENVYDLTNVIEHMLETQMYPNDDVLEGHVMQAIFNAKQYRDHLMSSEDENFFAVVFVPRFNDALINAYHKYLSSEIVVVSDKEAVQDMLAQLPDLNAPKEENTPARKGRKPKA